MGIMPHDDVDRALELTLSLDIPFWPQLPQVSFYEDMYAQASQNFPGISIDLAAQKLVFDTTSFEQELVEEYALKMEHPETFALTEEYSAVYHLFLSKELQGYKAIRGQVTGPVSFGFRVVDESLKPIIYNDDVRDVLFDFLQKKVNAQYRELRQKNPNAFVWLDEPGLGWVFSGLSGYNDQQAREDYHSFLEGIEGPKGLHLCANVNLPYLLELGVEILSFDAYQIEFMPKEYVSSVVDFITRGGIISWGIVPTESAVLATHTPETLTRQLLTYWEVIERKASLPLKQIALQALIAPARCCLRDTGQAESAKKFPQQTFYCSVIEEEVHVSKAFDYLKEISLRLKDACQV